jgi:hypothetical protein
MTPKAADQNLTAKEVNPNALMDKALNHKYSGPLSNQGDPEFHRIVNQSPDFKMFLATNP